MDCRARRVRQHSACASGAGAGAGELDVSERVSTDEAWSQATPKLARGMNLGNALDAPHEGEWGVTLSERHFQTYAQEGFDHVRLPVRFSSRAAAPAPYTLDESFMQRVDWAIDQATQNHLAIILDMHHYNS